MVSSKNVAYSPIGFSLPGKACKKKYVRAGAPPLNPPRLITGGLTSRGKGGTRFMRLMTSIRVLSISVSSVKVKFTNDEPELANVLKLVSPGKPCNTSSCGSRISDSISAGDAWRQLVKIVICGRSISGKS